METSLFDLFDPFTGEFRELRLGLADAHARKSAEEVRGRRLMVVPEAYRTPAIALDVAEKLADAHFEVLKSERPDLRYLERRLHGEHPLFFTFIVPVAEWQEAGTIPGGLMCSIDKLDGHIWANEEHEAYAAMVGLTRSRRPRR